MSEYKTCELCNGNGEIGQIEGWDSEHEPIVSGHKCPDCQGKGEYKEWAILKKN